MKLNLTGICKEQFIKWYKNYEPKSDWKYPAFDYFLNNSLEYISSVLISFFDSNDIAIKIEPYMGGGPLLFYGSVVYRNENFVCCEETIGLDQPIYTDNRLDMNFECFEMCNSIFNSVNAKNINIQLTEGEIKEELDDLPF